MKKPEERKARALVGSELRAGVKQVVVDRDGDMVLGELTPVEDGKPISGDLVEIDEAHPDENGWCPMKTLYSKGPPKVSTRKFCDEYDRIFGKRRNVGLA